MSHLRAALCVATILLMAPAVHAQAGTVQSHIDAARKASAELEYELALSELETALSSPDATEGQLLEAHYRAGIVCRIIGKDVDARNHFMWVLRRSPELTLPADTPPKIKLFFEAAREDALAERRVARQAEDARRISEETRLSQDALERAQDARDDSRDEEDGDEPYAAYDDGELAGDGHRSDESDRVEPALEANTAWAGWSLVAVGGISAVLGMIIAPIAGIGGAFNWLASEARANDYESEYHLAFAESERARIREEAYAHQARYFVTAVLLTVIMDTALLAVLAGIVAASSGAVWVTISGFSE